MHYQFAPEKGLFFIKRTLLSLMAVLLAFSPFHFTAIAEAQEVPTMRWLAQAGEKLFFFQNESKSLSYQVQGGALMQNPQLPVMSYAQRISTSQSSALFLFSNMVYSYTDGEPELLCTLAAYDPSKDLLLRALAANDVLYLLQGTTLYQFSLKTGELLAESSRYSDLCLGPNGAVFGWSYNMGTRQNELVPIQNGQEAGTPLCALDTYDNAGLAWDAATGWFYWTQGNTLYRWDGEQASPLSLMPFHANDIVQAYAAGGTYAVLLEQGQYDLYNLSSQGNEEQTALRIKGMYTPMPGADMLFSLASGEQPGGAGVLLRGRRFPVLFDQGCRYGSFLHSPQQRRIYHGGARLHRGLERFGGTGSLYRHPVPTLCSSCYPRGANLRHAHQCGRLRMANERQLCGLDPRTANMDRCA